MPDDSSVKLSVAPSTKILLKKLNCLLTTLLNLKVAFKLIMHWFRAVSKDRLNCRDPHRSLKPVVV